MTAKRSNRRTRKEKHDKEARKIKVYLEGLKNGITKRGRKLKKEACPLASDDLQAEIERLQFNKKKYQNKLNRLSA